MSAGAMIEVRDLVYDYPSLRALHRVSFDIEAGTVLALVGPNGAGKSTLMRCIAAMDTPTEGAVRVAGIDTQQDPRAVHAAIGYLPDFVGLYDELSIRRSLIYAARSRGVAQGQVDEAVARAAARVQLDDRLDQRAGELSRGLRQRLAIAQTIVHQPRALLLDEPAAGLDPEARRSLSDLILKLAGAGMTIVVSSHILAELEDYSSRMLMIRDGQIAGGGVVAAAQADEARVRVTFAAPAADIEARLAGLGLTVERRAEAVIEIALPPGEDAADLLTRLVGSGLRISAYQPVTRTLEDAYMAQAPR